MVTRTILAFAAAALAWSPAGAAAQETGHKPFEHHNPGRCVLAATMIDRLNRHDWRDTTIFSPARDTLFTATRESLRECERVYGGTAPEPVEMLNVARVQLFTGQDEAAAATQRRHLESVAGLPADQRAWELYLAFSDNMAGKPTRLDRARALLAELDALGKPAASVRVMAHNAMLNDAVERHDDEEMRREAAAVLQAWQELDEETRLWRATTLASAFTTRAAVEVLARGGDAARAVIDSARGIVPTQAGLARGMIERARRLYSNIDRTAAPLEAHFWYNVGAAGTDRPAPGRVSLILPAPWGCVDGCAVVDAARRLDARFRELGLDITFWTKTRGFYADTAPATPLAEAQYDSTYFLHHVKVPGALAITETKFSFRPDGRRLNEPTSKELNYPEAEVIVVDRNGIIRYAALGWNAILETRITDLIERLLKEEPPGGGGP